MTDEQKYTLPEARAELTRRTCAADGHAPSNPIKNHSSFVALRWVCDCGAMTWVPQRDVPRPLPIHRTEAGYPRCSTCDGGGCLDCTDPA